MLLAGNEPYLGVVMTYPESSNSPQNIDTSVGDGIVWTRKTSNQAKASGQIGISVVGAGLFANGTMLPALRQAKGVSLRGIASATGLTAKTSANKFGFDYFTTSVDCCLEDEETDVVLVLTRHDSHVELASRALRAGKSVLVEKPMATDSGELLDLYREYVQACRDSGRRWRHDPSVARGLQQAILPAHCLVEAEV